MTVAQKNDKNINGILFGYGKKFWLSAAMLPSKLFGKLGKKKKTFM